MTGQLIAFAFVLLALAPRHASAAGKPPDDPRYENRRLGSWLLAMPDWYECKPTNCRPFLALGSNAVPYLAWVVGRTNVGSNDGLSILRVLLAERTGEPSEEMLHSVQAKAAFVLEQLGSTARSATPELLVALGQGAGNQRLAAALALAAVALPQPKSIEMLEMMLNASPGMRIEAGTPAGTWPEVVLALGRLPADPRAGHWERMVSVVSLCVLSGDGGRAVQALTNRWTLQERAFRVGILPLLARRLRGQVLPVLRVAQADVDASVRRNAVVLLGSVYTDHPSEVTESLVRACRDESGVVRRVALEVLWGTLPNSNAAVDAALEGLNDEDDSVRAAAAARLSRYSGPRSDEIPPAINRPAKSKAGTK